ncbi:MAG: hypothetical protein ABEI99_04900 [Halobaculum sp.]
MPKSGGDDASEEPDDPLADRREQNRREGLESVYRWVEYIQNNPPEVWGPQQNRIVESQLESARETNLSVDHEQEIRAFADEFLESEADSGTDEKTEF